MSDTRGRNGSTFNNVVSPGFGLPTLSDLRDSTESNARLANSASALGSLHDLDRLTAATPHHSDAHHTSGGSILGSAMSYGAPLHLSDDDLFGSDSSSGPVQNLYSGHGHDTSLGGLVGGSNGVHAPPPTVAVGGQLWFGGEGVSADDGLFHIDSDLAGRDVADLTTAHVSFENVGLDPASGFYFGITADGLLRDGHITNDQETNEASQIATTDMIFGSGVSADEVQALAVDPLNHIIFVGLWGQADQYTGILEVRYDATTGALTNPYNASTGVVTDFGHMLLHDDNTGKVNGVNYTNAIAMQYDMQNSTLYYVDQTNATSISGGAGATWQATNGIYAVSTSGNVQGGSEPTPTLLSLNSQFAAGDNNNYIEGLAINEAQGIIYFCVNNASNSSSKLFYMPIAGGTATQITLPSAFFADNNLAGVNPISFDANLRQLYISDNQHSKIIQVTLDAAGHVASSTNMTWMDFHSVVGGSSATGLYFDPLPTLAALTGTSTEALQGGSALQLLTANPASITDPQDGASNKLHMGFMQVVVANAQTGDNLFYNGAQSGTFDSGKMTISWNSTTHTLTLTGNETEAFYASLFTGVSYQDSGTDNSVGSHPTRTIDWIISDGTTIVNQTTANSNEKATTVVIDRAPTLTADSYAVLESASASGTSGTGGTGVLGNDNDKDADAIVVTAVNGSGANVGNSVAGTYGHLTLNSNGSFSYLADNTSNIDNAANGSHPVDSFTYTVSDGLGGVTTTTVSFTIDRAPTVVVDSGAAVEGFSGSGNVLTNDSDKDGDTLTVSQVNGSGANVGNSVAGTYGHITINSNGSYTYNADNTAAIDAAATGSHLTDTFTYQANDGHGGTTTTTITVTLDRPPTAVNDINTANESGSDNGNVLTNDSDRDGDTLTVSAVSGNAGNVGNSTATTYGHVTINANGTYTYNADNTAAIDAAANGSHPVDVITFTVSDGHGGTTSETLSITIDRPAVAVADALATTESADAVNGSGGNPNLLANDVDKDGDAITITQVQGSGANVGTQIVLASGALLTVNADGTYTYDPNHAFDYLPDPTSGASNSTATDTFTYTVDGGSTVTVTITVTGQDSNDTLIGTSGNDTLNGGIGDDIIYDDNGLNAGNDPHDTSSGKSGGIDSFSGGSGNDKFYMGGNLTASDHIDGGTGTDTVNLNGDYTGGSAVTFSATTMVNVEILQLQAGHSYTLTMNNATVAAGQTLTVQAGTMGAGDVLTFDGSNDTTGGKFIITAGAGNDVLTGGHDNDRFVMSNGGNDTVHGGGGNDTINAGGALTAADVFDGGSGDDTLYLNGDYSAGVTFGATTISSIETIALAAGDIYNLTLDAANVGAGQTLTLRAGSLLGGDTVTFDGSAAVAGTALILNTGAGNDVLTGGAGDDTFRPGSGNDTVHGGDGNDTVNMGGFLTAADSIDGGNGTDSILLDGNYTGGNALTFGSTTMTNVEVLQVTAGNSYDLTLNALNVTSGQTLTVKASTLLVTDTFNFDASALGSGTSVVINAGVENDTLLGGAGDDVIRAGDGTNNITGGGGSDSIFAGSGVDTFIYNQASDSTSTGYDRVKGFDASMDIFQLNGFTVNAIDTAVTVGKLYTATFDTDLSAAIDGDALGAHDAVLFTPSKGDLHGHTFLIVDLNGVAGYQAGQDLVIDITGATNLGSLSTSDFTH